MSPSKHARRPNASSAQARRPLHASRLVGCLPICALFVFPPASVRAAPEDTTADAVLGQADFGSIAANRGGAAAANTMNGNRGIFIDPTNGRLWVSDTSNNRVLGFDNPAAFVNGQNADVVLGQVDFTGNLENKGAANPSDSSMSGPRSVVVDTAGRLYVADSSNFRILRFDPPIVSGASAVQVFGQPNFNVAVQNNGGTSNTSLGNPDGIACDAAGNIYLIDRNLHRVLIFNTPATTDTIADVVLGQADFVTSGGNNPSSNPADNNLLQPIAGLVDSAGNLFVCDEGNNRVLLFHPPLTNFKSAVKVFGQPNFTSNSSNNGGRSASSLFGPVGAALDPVSGRLYIDDPINSRILEYNDPLGANNIAVRVFGQLGDFTTGTINKGGPSADTLNDVAGVAVDAAGNLYASDRLNSRLLRYNAAPPPDMNTNDTSDMNTNDTTDMNSNGSMDMNSNGSMDMDTNGSMDMNSNGDDNTNGTMDMMETMQPCGMCCPGIGFFSPAMLVAWIAMRRRMLRTARARP